MNLNHNHPQPEMSALPSRLSRRDALRWMSSAMAALATLDPSALLANDLLRAGYGADPNLLSPTVPWDRTLSESQLRTVSALCDLIIPRDSKSPSASEVHVQDFIDEWISAPYPTQQKDRETILNGLIWIQSEAQSRFQKVFEDLSLEQQSAIADDIAYLPDAKAAFKEAATFFALFRNLTASGFYTTQTGTQDVGYIGNVPSTQFNGPPPSVLKQLGIETTPW